MSIDTSDDKLVFEAAIRALEAEIVNAGVHLVVDSSARQLYSRQIKKMSEELKQQVLSGKISWTQAAEQAQEARNVIMGLIRSKVHL